MTPKPRANPTARQQLLAPRKAEFLKVLKRIGNISEAARRAGVKASQGASWARAAGIENTRLADGRREEFDRLRTTGMSRRDAASRVGEHRKTAYRWDHARDADAAYKWEVTRAFVDLPKSPFLVEGPGLPPAARPEGHDP